MIVPAHRPGCTWMTCHTKVSRRDADLSFRIWLTLSEMVTTRPGGSQKGTAFLSIYLPKTGYVADPPRVGDLCCGAGKRSAFYVRVTCPRSQGRLITLPDYTGLIGFMLLGPVAYASKRIRSRADRVYGLFSGLRSCRCELTTVVEFQE